MLMPKRVKHRKQFRGSMRGKASRGNKITYGEYGIVAMEPCWIRSNQIEAAPVSYTHLFQGAIKRHGQHRGPMAHGSKFHRHQGSNGACSSPSKVFKGKGMPGQMGHVKVTVPVSYTHLLTMSIPPPEFQQRSVRSQQ